MDKKILILGAGGMLGHVLFRTLAQRMPGRTFATVRSLHGLPLSWRTKFSTCIYDGVDADNFDSIVRVMATVRPAIVINCIGIIKQLPGAEDSITSITINALFPHRLAQLCKASGARLIHISTDCVFDGKKGAYSEGDVSNATDTYGRTKYLGELHGEHCLTLRTSIVGHELRSNVSLIDWFLNQTNPVNGYTKAIYSGFPTVEFVRILEKYVIPEDRLSGLYQVSSEPINKYDLLNAVAGEYGKQIQIKPYDDFVLDRSLDSSRFRNITGYNPPSWQVLVAAMHQDYIENKDDYHATV